MFKTFLKYLGLFIAIIIIATISWYFLSINKTEKKQQEVKKVITTQEKEAVWCTTTATSQCFKYRCNSGYINYLPTPVPGSNGMYCSDGSSLEEVEEMRAVRSL